MEPFAQDFVIVDRSPARDVFLYEPALVRLANGELLATYEYMGPRVDLVNDKAPDWFRLAVSGDDGATWKQLPPLDLNSGMPLVHDGRVYLIGNRVGRRDIVILRSEDNARTWSPEVTLFEGHYWNAPTGNAIRDGIFYRAFGCPSPGTACVRDIRWIHSVVVAADLSRDLMEPASWRMSDPLSYPGTPRALVRGVSEDPDTCLEPNVVDVGGRLRVLMRLRLDGQHTAGMVAVNDLSDDGQALDYTFGQLYPMPFGHNKFHIVHDGPSGLFWACGNAVTNAVAPPDPALKARGYAGSGGNERRLLMLWYSLDAHNWFEAGCVAMSRDPMEAFNYAAPLVDGDDMLLVSRTALGETVNQNKSNLITFHRVRRFRDLALDIHPDTSPSRKEGT